MKAGVLGVRLRAALCPAYATCGGRAKDSGCGQRVAAYRCLPALRRVLRSAAALARRLRCR